MFYIIISRFFVMIFFIVVINVGIWVSKEINNLKYNEEDKKETLKGSIIIGIIFYVIYVVREVTKA